MASSFSLPNSPFLTHATKASHSSRVQIKGSFSGFFGSRTTQPSTERDHEACRGPRSQALLGHLQQADDAHEGARGYSDGPEGSVLGVTDLNHLEAVVRSLIPALNAVSVSPGGVLTLLPLMRDHP